jgi:hypothetical protein
MSIVLFNWKFKVCMLNLHTELHTSLNLRSWVNFLPVQHRFTLTLTFSIRCGLTNFMTLISTKTQLIDILGNNCFNHCGTFDL